MNDQNILPLQTQLLERSILVPFRSMREPTQRVMAEKIRELAAADNHAVIGPTHAMMKGEKIIGYLSLNGMTNVNAWFDTKHPHVMDSLKMIEMGELVLREANVQGYTLLCAEESPFTPHLERMGFQKLGKTVLYVKGL